MEERIEEKRIGVIFHHMLQNGPWLKCRTWTGNYASSPIFTGPFHYYFFWSLHNI